jgi:hypothetical protein
MSDWSLISEGGNGEGVVASTKSDDGFTMLNQRPTRINNRNAVASWVGTQVAASFPSDSTLNSANSSLGIAKVNDEASALPNRTQTVKRPITREKVTLVQHVQQNKKLIAGVEASTIRHFAQVICKPDDWEYLLSNISEHIESKFRDSGINSALCYVFWAKVYLLEDPKSESWQDVLIVASSKVPEDLNCWVLVGGDTAKVYAILKCYNLLIHDRKQLFKAGTFYFSFKRGVFRWEYQADDANIQEWLIKEGVLITGQNNFLGVSAQVPKSWYS